MFKEAKFYLEHCFEISKLKFKDYPHMDLIRIQNNLGLTYIEIWNNNNNNYEEEEQ